MSAASHPTLPAWRAWLVLSPISVRFSAFVTILAIAIAAWSFTDTLVNDRASGTIVGLMEPQERDDWLSDRAVFDQTNGDLNRRALLRIDSGPRAGDYLRVDGVPVHGGPREGDQVEVRLRGQSSAAWGVEAAPRDFAMTLACLALAFATGMFAIGGTQDWLKTRRRRP
ncbi:hypothetical protein V8J82_16030 [Gymnodinialimonas sp. 2305UL16-5]|uniref:hypothetical protein n=1 Tax=Gymnodinialimonas mytili TaxID=3126503 RepID=UPI00309A5DD3